MQCRLNQEKYLRKYSVKKHKEKPDRVYLAYKKVDNNRIEKEKRKVANDYLTQTNWWCGWIYVTISFIIEKERVYKYDFTAVKICDNSCRDRYDYRGSKQIVYLAAKSHKCDT